MIPAPFSGAEAGMVLARLGAIFIALGGIGVMLGSRRFAARALLLGLTICILASVSTGVFR